MNISSANGEDQTPNETRLRRIATILGETNIENLTALVADIRHFCDSFELDFHAAIDSSYELYLKDRWEY